MGEINQTNEMNGNNQSGNVVLQDPMASILQTGVSGVRCYNIKKENAR